MDKKYIVYKHTSPSGKVYIGITNQSANQRWRKGEGYKKQVFYNSVKKYGWDNIRHEILYTNLTKEDAESKEKELIKEYKTTNKKYGYNVENGGNSIGKLSEETKEKISKGNKGKKVSKETGIKISISKTGVKLKPLSEDTKGKIRNTKVGMKNPMYGVRGENCPMHYMTGSKNPFAKAIICITTGEEFGTMREASEKYKLDENLISKCCRGKQRTTGKHPITGEKMEFKYKTS